VSKGSPMSWRNGWPAACSALALVAAGCGDAPRPAAEPPRIPGTLASALATKADAVASALGRGDACAARGDASALSRMTESAQLAAVFRVKLVKAVHELSAALPPCSPPPPPAPPPPPPSPPPSPKPEKKHEHGKKEHGKKGHGHGKGHD
jgi:hypothetical protein